jgi:hypothetical protein
LGSDISGGVDNAGMILGVANAGIWVDGGSDISGGVLNQASGLVSGATAGLDVTTGSDISGGIDNRGLVRGGSTGIRVDLGSMIAGGIVNTGTVQGLAGPAILDGDAAIMIVNSGELIGGGGVALNLRGGDDHLTLRTGSTVVGDALGGGGMDTLRLEGSGVFADDIFGFETLEMAGSDWTLGGTATLDTTGGKGTAMVGSGLLRVNGTLTAPAGVMIAAPARLIGSGTVVGAVTNGGTIALGDTLGTLAVAGDVAFTAGSTLEVETNFAGTDLLDVTGSVTVDPTAMLDVIFAPGAPDVQDTTITSATGTVDANFQNINAPNALVTVELVGGNTLVLNGMGTGTLNTVTQAAAEEGFSFQRAVAGESRVRSIGPDSRLWALRRRHRVIRGGPTARSRRGLFGQRRERQRWHRQLGRHLQPAGACLRNLRSGEPRRGDAAFLRCAGRTSEPGNRALGGGRRGPDEGEGRHLGLSLWRLPGLEPGVSHR